MSMLARSISIRCVQCDSHISEFEPGGLRCSSCGHEYPVVNGIPVLIREDSELFPPGSFQDQGKNSGPSSIKKKILGLVPSISSNLSNKRVIQDIGKSIGSQAVVLIVGSGQQKKWLHNQLAPDVQCVCIDVDVMADVDAYADAHDLPFLDQAFDAVIQTAVLEHVLYPEKVVAEMHRVLKTGGLVYSELPFMQQVHGGAYDFYRATLSGHRRWFQRFEEIEMGAVAGPGTALAWSIVYFVGALSPGRSSRYAKVLARCLVFWLKYVDRLVANKCAALDGASCTFFYGRKSQGAIGDKGIVERYHELP